MLPQLIFWLDRLLLFSSLLARLVTTSHNRAHILLMDPWLDLLRLDNSTWQSSHKVSTLGISRSYRTDDADEKGMHNSGFHSGLLCCCIIPLYRSTIVIVATSSERIVTTLPWQNVAHYNAELQVQGVRQGELRLTSFTP
jgi:hypothetical protein